MPAGSDERLAKRWWSLKAKKTDFLWIDSVPIPRMRADMHAAITRALVPMSLDTALGKRTSTDSLKVKVLVHTEYSNSHGERIVDKTYHSIPVTTSKTDQDSFKKLLQITNVWNTEMEMDKSDWQMDGMPMQHKFKSYAAQLKEVYDWLLSKHIHIKPHGMTGSRDFFWWIVRDKSRAHILPKRSLRAGPAYNHPTSNCAIEAIKLAMQPIDAKQAKAFEMLSKKFQMGVHPDDYDTIARKLNRHIHITFAPSTQVAKIWLESGDKKDDELYASFGQKNRKSIHIHHWANHATAIIQKPKHEYTYVSTTEMAEHVQQRYEQIYQVGENHITFRDRADGVFETVQLEEIDGVKLDLGKTSPQSQLYNDFKNQIVPYSYSDPNRPQYDQFAKHGIHFSAGCEQLDDYDFDLKCAYSNYNTLPYYRGLPRDITYWINNPTIEQVKANSGFVLATFIDPIKDCEITAWLSCSAIDFLHDSDLIIEMLQAAFAHNTFELDTSKFIDHDPEIIEINGEDVEFHKIGKRVFHKLLGLSTQITATKRFITADPIEVWDTPVSQFKLPSFIPRSEELDTSLQNHCVLNVKYKLEAARFSHIAATIQDCVTTEVWRKWLEVKAANPDAMIITSLVDGIRIRKSGFTPSTFNFDNGRWVQKTISGNYTQPQCDWIDFKHTKAIVASDTFTPVKWSIDVVDTYKHMLAVAKQDQVSFLQLAEEGYINCLQGYAGCGKSYTIRGLLEQFNACILTPTHSTREDMESYSIRDYVKNEDLNSIPCMTYQSVIQRPNSINQFQVIIIDECGMLVAEHLNRIVQIVGRKLILLVGDPAQHRPIESRPQYLDAKYLLFKDYIKKDEELNRLDVEGSDWERKNMISHIHFDCTFDAPTRMDGESDTDFFDRSEFLRKEHCEEGRELVEQIRKILVDTFKFFTASEIPAFDTFECSKILTTVKRASDSDDGRALVKFCADVRERGIRAITQFCEKNPEFRIHDTSSISYDERNCAITYLNASRSMHNLVLQKSLNQQCNLAKTLKLLEPMQTLIANTKELIEKAATDEILHKLENDLHYKEALAKINFCYVDIDIPVIATATFTRSMFGKSFRVFNGTRGVMRNFMITFEGHEPSFPLTEIVEPKRASKLNPFKVKQLRTCAIDFFYGITSYRAQGRTMSEGTIYIDCSHVSKEMLYVACSRARSMDQLRFVYGDIQDLNTKKLKLDISHSRGSMLLARVDDYTLIKNDLNLGYRTSESDAILVDDSKRNLTNLALDWSDFDYVKLAKEIKDDIEFHSYDHSIRRMRRLIYKEEPVVEIKKEKVVEEIKNDTKWNASDVKFFNSIGNMINNTHGPSSKLERPTKIRLMGFDGEEEEVSYEFCARVERDGKRAFYWFIGSDDLLRFNTMITKFKNVECHEVVVDNTCSFFIDLDYKLTKTEYAMHFDNLEIANKMVSSVLAKITKEAAAKHGWDVNRFATFASQRSRVLDNGDTKLSIHLYTNISASFGDCKQLIAEIKQIGSELMWGSIEHEDDLWIEDMLEGIDEMPYHKNGSLGMPFGSKNGHQSFPVFDNQGIYPLISDVNSIKRDYNEIEETVSPKKSSSQLADLLAKLGDCSYYNAMQFEKTLAWIAQDGKSGLLKRKRAGTCKCCHGTHDNDNTLRVFITKKGSHGAICTRGGMATYF